MQADLLSRLKDGAVAKELYQHALTHVRERKPELEPHFVKNIGHGVRFISIEFARISMTFVIDGHGIP